MDNRTTSKGSGGLAMEAEAERQRLVGLCEFKASLFYRTSSRTGSKATQRNPILKRKKRKKETKYQSWKFES